MNAQRHGEPRIQNISFLHLRHRPVASSLSLSTLVPTLRGVASNARVRERETERERERERERDSLSPVARKSYDETASCPWQRRRRYRPVFAAGPTVTTAGVATPTNNNVTRAPRYPLPKLYFPWPVMSGWGWRWSRARGVGIALNRAPILPKRRRRTTAATIREYLSFPIQLFAFDSSFSIQLEF